VLAIVEDNEEVLARKGVVEGVFESLVRPFFASECARESAGDGARIGVRCKLHHPYAVLEAPAFPETYFER
jgi:hypothetical protein